MNIHDLMNWLAGGLQFVVAGYALRLNRVFGPVRVGWSLFCAFSLLALLHLFRAESEIRFSEPPAITLEVIYSLISLLLLTGMVHIESIFKERLHFEREEKRLRAGLEAEVQKKTLYLTRIIEALEMEIQKRDKMEAVIETQKVLLRESCRPMRVNLPGDCQILPNIHF